jgi:hypothetical protein
VTASLANLGRWRATLEAADFDIGRWEGGQRNSEGIIQMPYFTYGEQALRVIDDMPVVVFDWGAWMATDEARALLADHTRIADATADQLVKLCTALRRGDRFSEGTLAWAFESGLMLAIVRRAEAVG